MGRHRADDDGPRTVPMGDLGKLVAGAPPPRTEDVMEAAWEGERRRGGCFLAVAFVLCVILAAGLGWVWRNAGAEEAPPSSGPASVETVTAEPSPAPTVTRWRTRPPAAGKVVTLSPSPAPTVTRWRTRAPEPAPTVTVFKTRTLAPPDVEETVDGERESPRR